MEVTAERIGQAYGRLQRALGAYGLAQGLLAEVESDLLWAVTRRMTDSKGLGANKEEREAKLRLELEPQHRAVEKHRDLLGAATTELRIAEAQVEEIRLQMRLTEAGLRWTQLDDAVTGVVLAANP